MTEFSNFRRPCNLIPNLPYGPNTVVNKVLTKFLKSSVSRYVDLSKSEGHEIEIAPDFKLYVTTEFVSYPEKTGEVTVDRLSEKIRELEIDRSHYDRILHYADKIGLLSSPQLLSSDPRKLHITDEFWSYPEKTGGATVDYLSEKIRDFEIDRSHYDRISHDADNIGHRSSPQLLSSDPGKFHVPDKLGYVQSHYPGSNPGKFDFADVQLLRSDSAGKEAIQNTGMSDDGGGKGKDGEPTKDDERTLAWKLRLSVKAVTPKFNASAKISLEMKSGSGSNSKPPPLPPMPTPLAGKLYDCFLGFKKKFID